QSLAVIIPKKDIGASRRCSNLPGCWLHRSLPIYWSVSLLLELGACIVCSFENASSLDA
ncbi:hypothetical protein MKX01_039327, partial [Papaver californicum]